MSSMRAGVFYFPAGLIPILRSWQIFLSDNGQTKATKFLQLIAFDVPIIQLSNYLVKYSESESATFFTFALEAAS